MLPTLPFQSVFCDVFGATAQTAYTAAWVSANLANRVDGSTVFRSAGSLQEAVKSRRISQDVLRIFALEFKSGLGTVVPA